MQDVKRVQDKTTNNRLEMHEVRLCTRVLASIVAGSAPSAQRPVHKTRYVCFSSQGLTGRQGVAVAVRQPQPFQQRHHQQSASQHHCHRPPPPTHGKKLAGGGGGAGAGAIAGGKSKRVRTIFTPEQLERLEAEFERQQYMVGPERLYLAHTLQLTEAQVKVCSISS